MGEVVEISPELTNEEDKSLEAQVLLSGKIFTAIALAVATST